MQLIIDQHKCVGAGQCVFAAPEVFDQRDDDAIVVLLDEDPPESERANIAEAISACPVGAIAFAP